MKVSTVAIMVDNNCANISLFKSFESNSQNDLSLSFYLVKKHLCVKENMCHCLYKRN